MAGGFVGQILEGDGGLGGEHAIVAELIAGSLQQGAGLLNGALIVVVDGEGIKVTLLYQIGLEDAAVAVRHAVGDEGVSGLLAALSYVLDDVVAVDEDGEGLAHTGGLLGGLIGKEGALAVESRIVGAQSVDDVELGVDVLQGGDLIGGNGIDEVYVAGVVGGGGGGVSRSLRVMPSASVIFRALETRQSPRFSKPSIVLIGIPVISDILGTLIFARFRYSLIYKNMLKTSLYE